MPSLDYVRSMAIHHARTNTPPAPWPCWSPALRDAYDRAYTANTVPAPCASPPAAAADQPEPVD